MFEAEFCNPASGWEKGQVEKNVRDARHRLWQPVPAFATLPLLNEWLEHRCKALWGEIAHGMLPRILAPKFGGSMERIQVVRKGRFTLRGQGQRMPDGQFAAVFTVTERLLAGEVDMKASTGQLFGSEIDAADAGLQAAMQWVNNSRPTA